MRRTGRARAFVLAFSFAVAGCARDAPHADIAVAKSAVSANPGDSKAIRYLALGDSFTAGTGSRPDDAFPMRLSERWRAAGFSVTLSNLAVNGYTTDDVIERELPELPAFHASVVTLAIGANDFVHGSSIDRYRERVSAILAAIVASGVGAKHVITIPQPDWSKSPVATSFGDPAKLLSAIENYNAVLRDEAARIGGEYVDLFPLMQEEARAKMIASDGLHPSAPAHEAWSAVLFGRIAL